MNTDDLPDEPLATFEALRLPGWEWEVYEVEERGVTVAVGADATGETETEETDLFFGRVRSPNTYGRWEWGSFSRADLSRAAAYRTDEGDADVLETAEAREGAGR